MIYALIHYAPETLGQIEKALRELDLKWSEIRVYQNDPIPSPDQVSGLIIMGGPMGVDDVSAAEFNLIKTVIKQGKPVLGVCLGAQLIAKAMGSQVVPNDVKEVGWYPVDWPEKMHVLHWHGDTFHLPAKAKHLAKSERCLNQAFQVGNQILGLQYHMEVTYEMVKAWCDDPLGIDYIKEAGENREKILEQTQHHINNAHKIGLQVYRDYFSAAYAVKSKA